jgi:hypothetical protein
MHKNMPGFIGGKPMTTSKDTPPATDQKTFSITFTLLIWAGIALAFLGAIVAILGASNVTVLEGTFGNIEIKTTSVGLAILVIGSLLAGTIALRLPPGVKVLARSEQTLTEKIVERPIFLLGWSVVGAILLLISLLH